MLVEQRDLAVEQALVAAGEVDVQVADALLQELGLLLGDGDGHLLDRVEGLGEVTELVSRRHVDRREALELVGRELTAATQRVDEARQTTLGDVTGATR